MAVGQGWWRESRDVGIRGGQEGGWRNEAAAAVDRGWWKAGAGARLPPLRSCAPQTHDPPRVNLVNFLVSFFSLTTYIFCVV